MRWIDIIRISVRMLSTNGLRSMLTILGIGVAISLIVLLIGLGSGLQNITVGSIVQSKTLLSLDITPPPVANAQQPDIEAIKKIPGIKDASPVITTSGELLLGGKLASVAITAANPSYLEMEGIGVQTGAPFREFEDTVVVSPQILSLLDLNEDAVVGSIAKLNYTDPDDESSNKSVDKITVVGVSNVSTATIYVPYSLLSNNGKAKINSIKAVATDRNSLVKVRDTLSQQGFSVETLIDTLDQARSVFRWVTIGLTVFGTIALVVAAIGMFNTLTISLLERTREIGIMKAIGVDNSTVKKLFLAEAGMLGFLGGLAGIGMGLLLAYIINTIFNQISVNLGGLRLDIFQYPTGFLPTMVAYPTVLAILTGLYPAIRASRINPLRALRYE